MPVAGTFITETDCQDELSAEVWQRILDDNADGAPDANPGQRLIDYSESFVLGRLGPQYPLATLIAMGTGVMNEVKRLMLDAVRVRAYQRHPAYIRGDWQTLLVMLRQDLKELRDRVANLGVATAPEPAANEIGWVESGSATEPDPEEAVFLGPDAMGHF